ncbi:hypothetical protein BFW01_g12840 [Lasiodiplodia theobromae]|nr:hypothetical protein BFW01_g12840 [Lasiodiplodia theobromae]
MLSSYENYAEDCYDNVSGLGSCNAFIKADIPTMIDTNASCPFGDDICMQEYGNIVFDTGYLDSHLEFGINAPPNERVQFRRVSSCAPIKTDGYRKSYRLPDSNNSYSRYYYGDSHVDYSDDLHTYEYPEINWDTQTSGQDVNAARTDYTIRQSNAFVLNGSYASYTDFLPIPALRKMDADLHLMYLSSNMIGYSEEVDDPWFSAHVDKMKWYNPVNSPDAPPDTLYTQDEPVSVLACYVSEQYCNPNLPEETRCSPVGGISESAFLADGLWQNAKHQRMFRWFASIITASGVTLDVVPGLLGDAALTARHGLQLGHSGPLPGNQWQLEVEHWHRTSLVATQAIIADTAKGISDMHLEPWLVRPNNTEEKHLCNSQKIRNAEYFNFSVFGLAFTIALGSLIIVLSYTLEPTLGWVQRRRSWDTYARLEWVTNETLQLQRLAHEELGSVKWEGCAENVPVTRKGEKLAVLDLHDLDHPRLKAPPRTFAGV